jgi:hypothetical protein
MRPRPARQPQVTPAPWLSAALCVARRRRHDIGPGTGTGGRSDRASRLLAAMTVLASLWSARASAEPRPEPEPDVRPEPPRVAAAMPAVSPVLPPAVSPVLPPALRSTDPSTGPSVSSALDGREVVVPVRGAERIRIDNPLGNVIIRAWSRPETMHIVAEKRAASPAGLDRLRVHFTAFASGEIAVETRVDLGGRERALPLIASGIDLVVEVPPDLEVSVKTFGGSISASGLRSATRLETTGGRIQISDIRGRVITRQLRGGQSVAAVDGDVELDGVEGQMRLDRVGGERVEVRIVDGDIRAEDLRSDQVRLASTLGDVVLVGIIRPHGHYDLRSYEGEVRLGVTGAPAGFELRARSGQTMSSLLALKTTWRQGDRIRALVEAVPGSRDRTGAPTDGRVSDGSIARPIVELTSVIGRVVIDTPQTLRADQDNRPVRW